MIAKGEKSELHPEDFKPAVAKKYRKNKEFGNEKVAGEFQVVGDKHDFYD